MPLLRRRSTPWRVFMEMRGAPSLRITLPCDGVGNAETVMNARGHVSTTVYDALDRVSAQIDPLGYARTLAYDAGGRKRVVPANGALDPC
jgi:YD repeat-containing protein